MYMSHSDLASKFGTVDASTNIRFTDIHVLIIEDSCSDTEVVRGLLSKSRKCTYTISVVQTVSEALSLFAEQRFDICLLDFFIGSDNAWTILDVTSKIAEKMPLILVTDFDDEDIDDQLAATGVADCLKKGGLSRKMLERSIRYALHAEAQKKRLEELAHHDALTGLVNRNVFFNALENIFRREKSADRVSALFYIDIDHFKLVNDKWGHDSGDLVLTSVASRIASCVRKGDVIARLGGDEFALIVENLTYPECHMIAQKILCSARKPIKNEFFELQISLSIGFSLLEDKDLPMTTYVKRADEALYEAKKTGRNAYKVFSGELAKSYEETLHLGAAFAKAVSDNALKLYFQPVLCAKTRRLLSLEALLRWPVDGKVLLPEKILPVVERIGAMDLLSEWVIKEACSQLSHWLDKYPSLVVSVNIAISQLVPNLITYLMESFHNSKIPASNFQIEIHKFDRSPLPAEGLKILNVINELGVNIAIDNFGNDFSSLSELAYMPTSSLKLNQSFIHNIEENCASEKFLKAAIHFAQELGIEVVGEGVETLDQQNYYQQLGVDELQGYLYSKPLNANQCSKYLEHSQSRHLLQ